MNGGNVFMKQWEKADIVELKIKSTAQNGLEGGIDLELPGGDGFKGTDVPASGSTRVGTWWD